MRMIDADKLLEIVENLKSIKGEYADSFVNMEGSRSIELDRLEDYIENAPTLSRFGQWFKVEDKLPERGIPVLVLVAGTDWNEPVEFLDIDCLKNDGLWDLNYLNVMYWTPLPEAPKGGENK